MKQIIDPPLPRDKWRVSVGVPALLAIGFLWLIVFTLDSFLGGAINWLRDWLERGFDRVGMWLNQPNRWPVQRREK